MTCCSVCESPSATLFWWGDGLELCAGCSACEMEFERGELVDRAMAARHRGDRREYRRLVAVTAWLERTADLPAPRERPFP